MRNQIVNVDALYQATVAIFNPQSATVLAALYDQLNAAEQRGYDQGKGAYNEAFNVGYECGYGDGDADGYERSVSPELPLDDAVVVDMTHHLGARGVGPVVAEEDFQSALDDHYAELDMHFGATR